MKKFGWLFVALLLMFSVAAAAEETVIINKIIDTENDFAFPEDAKLLEVYFPKINGCDAALVRCGEYAMLIDCAGNQWSEVEKLLEKLNVTQLTYALNSHPDADHIGGFNHVLKNVPAGEFLLGFPEDYPEGDAVRFKVYEDLHEMGVPFRRVQDGDTLEFGDVNMTVHQKWRDELVRTNGRSVMLRIEYGERSILFTGDIQWTAQTLYVDDQDFLKADVMKYPHHGYDRMNPDFISLVDPELIICTSGRGTAEKAITQMRDLKLTHHFAENGIIRLATDGTVWTVERMK